MLRDGGIERGFEVWRPLTYNAGQWVPDAAFDVETDPGQVIRGRASMRIENRRSVADTQTQVSQARLPPVEANHWYQVGFLARSDRPVFALRISVSIERMPDARAVARGFDGLRLAGERRRRRVDTEVRGGLHRADLHRAVRAAASGMHPADPAARRIQRMEEIRGAYGDLDRESVE